MNVHTIQLADCVGTRSSANHVYVACVVVTRTATHHAESQQRAAASYAALPAKLAEQEALLTRLLAMEGFASEADMPSLEEWRSVIGKSVSCELWNARRACNLTRQAIADVPFVPCIEGVISWHHSVAAAHKALGSSVCKYHVAHGDSVSVRTDVVVRQTAKRGTTARVTASLSEED